VVQAAQGERHLAPDGADVDDDAGYGAYGVLEATPEAKIERQFDTNVIGLIDTTKAVLPHFRANGAGVIVNISSLGGKMTFPLGSLYHGTKFAVEGFSEALSYELEPLGIRVKIVEPGGVDTDFGGRSFDFTNDESLAEYQPLVQKLMAALAAGVPGITGQCGGGITCSTCLCNVPDEWLPRLPPQHQDEIDLLAFVPEAGSNSRLICQIPASEALDGLYLQVVITTPPGDA